ncbi:uncharacterized protein LOC144599348 [Rhinoraja longicauda]
MSSLSSSSTFRSERYSNYSRRSSGDPSFDQYVDAARNLFEDEMEKTPFRNGHFVRPRNESFGYAAPAPGRQGSLGNVNTMGDTYQVTADVSQFDPEDIIVTMYNYYIVIKAEKVAEDGTITNTVTHKYQLPEDMDPLSVSCSRTDVGILTINVRRAPMNQAESPQPVYRNKFKLQQISGTPRQTCHSRVEQSKARRRSGLPNRTCLELIGVELLEAPSEGPPCPGASSGDLTYLEWALNKKLGPTVWPLGGSDDLETVQKAQELIWTRNRSKEAKLLIQKWREFCQEKMDQEILSSWQDNVVKLGIKLTDEGSPKTVDILKKGGGRRKTEAGDRN